MLGPINKQSCPRLGWALQGETLQGTHWNTCLCPYFQDRYNGKMQVLLVPVFVTLDKLLGLTEPWLPYPSNGDENQYIGGYKNSL